MPRAKLQASAGDRFGMLVFVEQVGYGKRGPIVNFKCECGNTCSRIYRDVYRSSLKKTTPNCGCRTLAARSENGKANRTHGLSYGKLYDVYRQMIRRCYNHKSKDFPLWGGRGISVCDVWLSDIQSFFDWAVARGYGPGLTIERYNNDDGYHPLNCIWIPNKDQARNTRRVRFLDVDGERMSVADWSRKTGIPYRNILSRLRYGWSEKRAVSK